MVGNYRITREIGAGGMGTVYAAEHSVMDQEVAIKFLLSEYTGNEAILSRFFNEARATAAIKHPGIVDVIDVGHRPSGEAYLMMEYLEGESLGDRMRRLGRLPPSMIVRLTGHIAAGLEAAHRAGIVHRDLKPDNIFIVRDAAVPGGERTKILDFGIAKLFTKTPGALETRTGQILGTPAYMAPEQCKGAGKVDHRSDLYALGCILFDALSGRPPFVAQGSGEVLAQHIYENAPRIRSLAPETPKRLDAIIALLLEKDPDKRFQSAQQLQEKLRTVPTRPGVAAAPTQRMAKAPTGGPPTTISSASGQFAAVPPRSRRGRQVLFVGILTATVSAAAFAFLLRGKKDAGTASSAAAAETPSVPISVGAPVEPDSAEKANEAPEPVPPSEPAEPDETAQAAAPVASTVSLEVGSEPEGATVYDETADKLLGLTPLALDIPALDGPRWLVIRAEGFVDERRKLAGDAPGRIDATLSLKSAPPAEAAPPKAEPIAKTKKPTSKRPRRAARTKHPRPARKEKKPTPAKEDFSGGGTLNPF